MGLVDHEMRIRALESTPPGADPRVDVISEEITDEIIPAINSIAWATPYKTGDTISISYVGVSGVVTNGKNDIVFTLPLPKIVGYTGTATISGSFTVRDNGTYLYQGTIKNFTTNSFNLNDYNLVVAATAGWITTPTTNNVSISVVIENATITFN